MATKQYTERLYNKLASKYGTETADKLFKYIDLVLERNEKINLTAITDRDEAMQKHLADSLSAIELPEYAVAESVIDVGTGAGFPGALLAIVHPEKNFTLLDSTMKRLKVVDEFAEILGIDNIETYHERAEVLSRRDGYRGAFDLCVCRAVASLDKLCKWCLPFVRNNGALIAYKGENYQEEIDQSEEILRKLNARVDRVVPVDDETGDISGHVLVVIKKNL